MTKPRLLYVEDSSIVGRFLVDALSFEGVEVVLVETAAKALSVLADRHAEFALVLCDLRLPDQPGLELMAQIRAAYPDLRLVLTTGFVQADIESEAALYDGLLPKPFDARDVLALLEAGSRADASATG